MLVCEPVLKSGPNKGQTGTGTLSGVGRHHRIKQPACEACYQALVESPGGKSKGFAFKRDRKYRELYYTYPVTVTIDPSIIRDARS